MESIRKNYIIHVYLASKKLDNFAISKKLDETVPTDFVGNREKKLLLSIVALYTKKRGMEKREKCSMKRETVHATRLISLRKKNKTVKKYASKYR